MRLIGYIEGVEVKFDFYPPNKFIGIIPKKLDGKYIAQFILYDDAGNQTSLSTILIYIDFNKMDFKILNPNNKLDFNIKSNNYFESMKINTIYSEKIINNFIFKKVFSNYTFKELIKV